MILNNYSGFNSGIVVVGVLCREVTRCKQFQASFVIQQTANAMHIELF